MARGAESRAMFKGVGEPGAPNRVTGYYTQRALLLDVGQIVAQRPKLS